MIETGILSEPIAGPCYRGGLPPSRMDLAVAMRKAWIWGYRLRERESGRNPAKPSSKVEKMVIRYLLRSVDSYYDEISSMTDRCLFDEAVARIVREAAKDGMENK